MPKEEQELYKTIGESFVRVRRVRENSETNEATIDPENTR
jgi:hypothetical protein